MWSAFLDSRRGWRLFLLAVVVGTGAWLRLTHLGDVSLRGDTLHFWNICREPGITAWTIVEQWKQRAIDHPALPLVLTRFVIDVCGLPVTFFTIRLPSALFGIATILVGYGVGRRLGGAATGLVTALLVAWSPFMIQMSQEAYFYSAMILGSFMIFRALLDVVQTLERPAPLGTAWFVTFALGFLLVVHSQYTGWSTAYLYAACMMGVLFWRMRRGDGPARRDLLVLVGLLVAHTVVLLLTPWGPMYVIAKIWSPMKGVYAAVAERSGENAWTMLFRTTTSFGWGWTAARAVFTFAVLAFGLLAMARQRAHRPTHTMMAGVLALAWVIFFVSRQATASLYESRYVAGLLPVYGYVFVHGLLYAPIPETLPRVVRQTGRAAWLVLAAALLAGPAYLCTRLTGQPVPYRPAVDLADRVLPQGAPVLVDRWFEPWNELAAHPASNVVFTFTVPNEPLENFLRNQWRATAQDFLVRNPDAGYLQIAKTYWEVPTVGPWAWPGEYFARHVGITNVAGLRLRELGLAARGDYYDALTNRVIVDFYYNTREDVMQQRAARGERAMVWYGRGWRFEKSGPMGIFRVQTQDFRDWRMLSESADVEVINLTRESIPVFLNIRGVAIGGAKTVQLSPEQKQSFPASRLTDWRVGPLLLKPGTNVVPLTDPLWSLAQHPLLVERIAVEDAPPDTDLSRTLIPSPAGR